MAHRHLVVICVLLLPLICPSIVSAQKWIDEIRSGFGNTVCYVQHEKEFTPCFDHLKQSFSNRAFDFADIKASGEPADLKAACCNYFAYRNCIDVRTRAHCGQYHQATLDSFTRAITGASDVCDDQFSQFSCFNILAVAGLAALGIGLIIILIAGIWILCKRCCC